MQIPVKFDHHLDNFHDCVMSMIRVMQAMLLKHWSLLMVLMLLLKSFYVL